MNEIIVKGRRIGNRDTNICVPLLNRQVEDLLAEAKMLTAHKPDLIEWRVDYFNEVSDPQKVLQALADLNKITHAVPLIFTYRDSREGGHIKANLKERVALIKSVIRTGWVDLIDIELLLGRQIIQEIINEAHSRGIFVIVSQHDFEQTLPTAEMVNTLIAEQEVGADIAKIAVMPKQPSDVLQLMEAALQFKEAGGQIPVVSIAMSQLGVISRIAGGLFGSAITFAAHQEESAPGQISLAKLRSILKITQPE